MFIFGFIPFFFFFFSWRLITLQYCSDFCHTLTRLYSLLLSHLGFLSSRDKNLSAHLTLYCYRLVSSGQVPPVHP